MALFKRHIGSAGCESPGEPRASCPGVLHLTHHKSPSLGLKDFSCNVSIKHLLCTCQEHFVIVAKPAHESDNRAAGTEDLSETLHIFPFLN